MKIYEVSRMIEQNLLYQNIWMKKFYKPSVKYHEVGVVTVYPLCASFFHFIQTSNALSSPFEERGGKQRDREKIYNWWLSALRQRCSVIGHNDDERWRFWSSLPRDEDILSEISSFKWVVWCVIYCLILFKIDAPSIVVLDLWACLSRL